MIEDENIWSKHTNNGLNTKIMAMSVIDSLQWLERLVIVTYE